MAQHTDKERRLQEREAERKSALREALINRAIAEIADTDYGRKFLWWLLEIGQVNQQPFVSNALNTAFNCGELNVGNKILAKITEVDPAIYVRMQVEHLNDNRTDNSARNTASADDADEPDLDL